MTPGNVFASDVVDRGPWLFYDRKTAAAAAVTALNYDFFQATSNYADCNLQRPGALPPPEAFSVQALGFIFATTMLFADVAGIIKNYFMNFSIGIKNFAQGPLHLFPGGAGISATFATNSATAAMLQVVNNGDPSLLCVRRFPDYPRIIPANVAFKTSVTSGGTTVTLAAAVASSVVSPAYGGLDLLHYLDGILDREVQ